MKTFLTNVTGAFGIHGTPTGELAGLRGDGMKHHGVNKDQQSNGDHEDSKFGRVLKRLGVILFILYGVFAPAQSIERAKLYKRHDLVDEAKKECIDIFTSTEFTSDDRSYSLYLLGLIAFEENRISDALTEWELLIELFPQSRQALEVVGRIDQLAQIVSETHRETINNATAELYLRHGDFWSRGKSNTFVIDSSWIGNVEAAIKWYDLTITEFPDSIAAKIAYEEKMRVIIGWEDPGRYGSTWGIREDPIKYIPVLVSTFSEYATAFPNSGLLQSFRYQIAQAYWRQKSWTKTREWLNAIILADDQDTFYRDLAQRRLQKMEY